MVKVFIQVIHLDCYLKKVQMTASLGPLLIKLKDLTILHLPLITVPILINGNYPRMLIPT
jgi:hypothetical protein